MPQKCFELALTDDSADGATATGVTAITEAATEYTLSNQAEDTGIIEAPLAILNEYRLPRLLELEERDERGGGTSLRAERAGRCACQRVMQ